MYLNLIFYMIVGYTIIYSRDFIQYLLKLVFFQFYLTSKIAEAWEYQISTSFSALFFGPRMPKIGQTIGVVDSLKKGGRLPFKFTDRFFFRFPFQGRQHISIIRMDSLDFLDNVIILKSISLSENIKWDMN